MPTVEQTIKFTISKNLKKLKRAIAKGVIYNFFYYNIAHPNLFNLKALTCKFQSKFTMVLEQQ